MATKTPSHHLKNKEFQIVRLLHAPQDGVVGALLPCFDLPQLHPRVRAASRSILMNSASDAKWLHEHVARYPPRGSSFMAR